MKLVLGVLDVPYGATPSKRGKSPSAPPSTGDVATILEAKYHIFQNFWDAHNGEIVEAVTSDLQDFFEDRLSGSRANAVNFTAAESTIKTMFNKFIDSKEMDGRVPGVPTEASLRGVSHRFKRPYAKGHPVRPSFRDTGLMEQSFVAKLEE